MPVTTMGIGRIGDERAVFKRKMRWILNIGATGDIPTGEMWYARTTNRPTLNIEETPIDHLHEKHYISGKPTWDTVGITIYDVKFDEEVGTAGEAERSLHSWLNSAWKYSNDNTVVPSYNFLDMGDHDLEYKIDLTLRMLDGHGDVMETWWLLGCWPSTVNWGDLDYSSSDTADVEVTVRFDRAQLFFNDGGLATGGAPSA